MNNQSKPVALLFNPSIYIAGAEALGLGLGAMVLAAVIGWLGNTHFDGVLDTHVGVSAPLWVFLVEGILDWLCLSVVLLILGRMISRTGFRAVDVLGTQALARWPALIISVVLLPSAFQRISNDLARQLQAGGMPRMNLVDGFVLAVTVVALLILVCWMVALMYKAFSISCNVKGGKAIGTFIGGLIFAEIISKICIVLLFQHAVMNQAIAADLNSGSSTAVSSVAGRAEQTGDLSASAGAFVDLLAKKDFAAAEMQFDATMKSALPEATLRAVWDELLGKAGAYQKQLGTRQEKQAGYDVVFVTCQFKNKRFDMKVVYDSRQRVTGLFYMPSGQQ